MPKNCSIQNLNALFNFLNEFDNVTLWIKSIDNHRQLYISEGYQKTWGQSTATLYQQPQLLYQSLVEDGLTTIKQRYEQQLSKPYNPTHLQFNQVVYRIRSQRDAQICVQDRSTMLYNPQGAPVATAGVSVPISTRQYQALASGEHHQDSSTDTLSVDVFGILKNELQWDTQATPNSKGCELTVSGKNYYFSKREMDCLRCLIQHGQTAKQTAKTLNISPRTVEEYLQNIKNKVACRSKLELIALLKEHFA